MSINLTKAKKWVSWLLGQDYWFPAGLVLFGDTPWVMVVLVALLAKVSFPGSFDFSGVPPDIFWATATEEVAIAAAIDIAATTCFWTI